MILVRLKKIGEPYFQEAWNLYEDAFPKEERRLLDVQKDTMNMKEYHFDILIEEGKFIGLLFWWDLETYRYIDHFATVPEHRNRGLGKLILEAFLDRNHKPVLLEVELPDSDINQRRIKFYERVRFKLNKHYYEIPTLEDNQTVLQLLLMSYPDHITENEMNKFVQKYHPVIFDM